MYNFKLTDQVDISFRTKRNVFYPTSTSSLLIKALKDYLVEPKKLLDLGCGVGIIGIILSKLQLVEGPLYASDLSNEAVKLTKLNAKDNEIELIAKVGSLFDPWQDEKFDVIVDDISGIAQQLGEISFWFDGVPCNSGEDGTELIMKVIENAPLYLKEGGKFFFPVLSLSNEEKIMRKASEVFKCVDRLERQKFSLPDEMKENEELINSLLEKKFINVEKKFGMILWHTDICVAYN